MNIGVQKAFKPVAQLGEIYYMNVSGFNTALAAQDTWYQLIGFDTNGLSNGVVVPDHTNDHITVGRRGKYRITVNVSSRSSESNIYHFMVRLNNGATNVSNLMAHSITNVANKIEDSSISGFASLSAGDTVEVWVQRKDGGAVTKTITIEHINLAVERVSD